MLNHPLSKLLYVVVSSLFIVRGIYGDCLGPQMKLLSDNPRHTCTEIFASKDRIEYKCTSLIKGFPKAMIKYCPVEVCMKNGTWSKPSISCALSECYEEGRSMDYVGHRMCTNSGRHCQRWDAQEPQRHKFRESDLFPDYSIRLAGAYCRDPGGSRGAPWCFTTDPKKKSEVCGIKKCSEIIQTDGYCGPKPREKDKQNPDNEEIERDSAESAVNEKSLLGKPNLDKVEHDDKESLYTCSRERGLFRMKTDYRIRGKIVMETHKRSTLDCATFCSQMTVCNVFTFRPEIGTCILHGGNEFVVIKSRGFKAGIKTCNL